MSLEEKINYEFSNKNLLENALTHSSFAYENHNSALSNERLEFLGDSILSLIVSEFIYSKFPDFSEGELSKLRSGVVCEKSLGKFAGQIELGKYLKLSKGEIKSRGNEKISILSDAFEALIAAIYLDSGYDSAKCFVLSFIKKELNNPVIKIQNDYKTLLQEIVQKNPDEKLVYSLVGESGPDHKKQFIVEAKINNNIVGKGKGHSIKEAEQLAAKCALELMGMI